MVTLELVHHLILNSSFSLLLVWWALARHNYQHSWMASESKFGLIDTIMGVKWSKILVHAAHR